MTNMKKMVMERSRCRQITKLQTINLVGTFSVKFLTALEAKLLIGSKNLGVQSGVQPRLKS